MPGEEASASGLRRGAAQDDSVAAEVDKVVSLIVEHARTRPAESLGVIALGMRHAERVDAARLRMMTAILKVLDAAGQRLHVLERDNVAGWERICFSVMATRREHARVLSQLKSNDATDHVVVFEDAEVE